MIGVKVVETVENDFGLQVLKVQSGTQPGHDFVKIINVYAGYFPILQCRIRMTMPAEIAHHQYAHGRICGCSPLVYGSTETEVEL